MYENDVITAIATAHGQGAIGIVRLSGAGVLDVLARVFRGAGASPPAPALETHRMYYGEIVNSSGEIVDEVMVCPMLAPRSFTREDTVEIYTHGGMLVVAAVLETVLARGARLAQPGEFTKRAFLNGRINLSQAEAVMDLITAKSGEAHRAALRQLGGGLSRRLEATRDKILTWLAHIELSIDYPEHEEEARNASQILSEGGLVISGMKTLAETAGAGRIIREGIRTAIIGRPNVGKSTLLNAILHENRAIVHETAGTTRDILTEAVRVADIPLIIMDTAGLRETQDPIEQIGIQKTREAAQDAELILYIADSTQGLTKEDIAQIEKFPDTKIIVLLNKSDIKTERASPSPSHELFGKSSAKILTIEISAKTGDGLENLYKSIKEMFLTNGIGAGAEADIITRERHRVLLSQAIGYVEKAMEELRAGVPEDLVSVSLRAAYIALGEILGAEIGDDIVDRIFDEFCLGK